MITRTMVILAVMAPLATSCSTTQSTVADLEARIDALEAKLNLVSPTDDKVIEIGQVPERPPIVYVTGQIASPGPYAYTQQLTLRRAIAQARGFGDFANPRKVRILRRDSDPIVYDITSIDEGELEDPELYVDDIIVVPRKIL